MDALYDFFAKPTDPRRYCGVKVALAAPEQIFQWSHGEIKKPETINYRTFKPERDGLFCAKIFGPTKDYECNCGKYKRMKHRGVICEKCGVEVIQSKVRRDRLAHIELATPCAHIWFMKSLPSKIGNLLDLTLKNVEKVLYFDSYIILEAGDTGLTKGHLISEEKLHDAIETHGQSAFKAGIGAEAIQQLLTDIELDSLDKQLRTEIRETNSQAKRQKLSKRLKIVDAFRKSGVDPSWMVMSVIPVLPPDLRPLVPLEGGRFATSDLNDLYRRVINRNNRLKRLMELNAPDIIVRNEKRMLQESVDVLFDNGRHGRVVTGTNKRPLKSLSDTLKGKQGRFRQNLLGKRVDYSGRTVITVGPELRLHQCGLPKKMALELFKPFVYYKLEENGAVSTVKSAKKLVEREEPQVWDTLDEVVKEYPIMLNRAPTLHRLGIQAFEPTLIEGKAIQLHPLVCTAFNADFDGDQMAVHVPLSVESQIEARVLMLSSNNILSPANGEPIINPSQDIVLGIYYMTREVDGGRGDGRKFSDIASIRKAFENKEVDLRTRIAFSGKDTPIKTTVGRMLLQFQSPDEVVAAYDAGAVKLHTGISVRMNGQKIGTTPGRILLWQVIPQNPMVSIEYFGFEKQEDAASYRNQLLNELTQGSAAPSSGIEPAKVKTGTTGWLDSEQLANMFNLNRTEGAAICDLNPGDVSELFCNGNHTYLFKAVGRRSPIPFSLVNCVMVKKKIRELIDYAYRNLGAKATVILADRLKDFGYQYSTIGGLSISIDAMIIPKAKKQLIEQAEKRVLEIKKQYDEGLITEGEKYNKVVDIWAKATDDVANEMMHSMENARVLDDSGKPVLSDAGQQVMATSMNPIFMMSDSGARGSKDQMRQLAGMRGLMAKPSGEIIETPIQANFREGLSVLQYFTSTHGARKGLADTALKTANSGYLTRRLADVAQDCAVTEIDCGTMLGVDVEALVEGGEVIQKLHDRILGRVLTNDLLDPFTDEVLVQAGAVIDEAIAEEIENAGITSVRIRSVLTCRSQAGVCARCYGRDLAHGKLVEIGQTVGILAAQSIGEPGTQLTMRTFHIGGTASRKVEQADIKARMEGTIKYLDLHVVKNAKSEYVVMNRRGGEFAIVGDTGRELERFPVIYGAHLMVEEGTRVQSDDLLASWDPFTTPILTEVDGEVKFGDIVSGKTLQEKVDPVTGKSIRTITESKNTESRPRISIKDASGKTAKLPDSKSMARYPLPVDAILMVDEGDEVKAGEVIAKRPRATTKTKDITGGLPRVAELFEVRKPKEIAVLTEIDGYVSIAKATKKGRQKVTVTPVDVGDKKEYSIPRGRHINVAEGDYVRAGDQLTSGDKVPQDILSIKGEIELARYLVNEVQEVYRLQGVRINDKHIEVIVRQMMRRVKILSPGDSDFVVEEQVDRFRFEQTNQEILEKGKEPAQAQPLILGITKASLSTESFISAASFQETTKVLTDAAIAGKEDYLSGLKENVIMGRLIPAGTGMAAFKDIDVEFNKNV